MYMPLVGLERRHTVPYPYERHPDGIEYGDDEQRVRHDEIKVVAKHYVLVVHRILHAKHSQYEPQRKAAGIAHEDFTVLGNIAEDIEIKKRDKHADKPRNHDGIRPDAL